MRGTERRVGRTTLEKLNSAQGRQAAEHPVPQTLPGAWRMGNVSLLGGLQLRREKKGTSGVKVTMEAVEGLRDRTSTLKWAAERRDLAKETEEWAKEKQNKKGSQIQEFKKGKRN